MRMPSTAEEVMTFAIKATLYLLGSFRYGFVSFNDFFFII